MVERTMRQSPPCFFDAARVKEKNLQTCRSPEDRRKRKSSMLSALAVKTGRLCECSKMDMFLGSGFNSINAKE